MANKIFLGFIKEKASRDVDNITPSDVILVREGFSFSAFFFHFFWALYNNLYRQGALLAAAIIIPFILYKNNFLDGGIYQLTHLFIIFYCGLAGNDWLQSHYAKNRDYPYKVIISAIDLEEARVKAYQLLLENSELEVGN